MQTLFNDLNIQAIVIIEDEIIPYTFNQYLAWMFENESLLETLVDMNTLVDLSKVLLTQLNTFNKKEEVKTRLMYGEAFASFSSELDDSVQTTFNELNDLYNGLDPENLFWNTLATLDSNYDEISKILNEIPLPKHYMNDFSFLPATKDKLNAQLTKYTPEGRVFYIVDKTFGGNSKGYEIIKFLRENEIRPLPISILFTSHVDPLADQNNSFHREISKLTTLEKLKTLISEASKTCEYHHAIETLFKENQTSLENAKDQIIKSKALFSKIIHTAHDEGVSPYEVMNEWLTLSQHYYFSSSMSQKLGSTFGSSKVFLDHDPALLSDIHINDMHLINSFEIFDPHINNKYLPIAPGDIFVKAGEESKPDKYYVLVGQACDTSCRSNQTRKTNIAELLEASITKKKYSDKAQMLSDNEGTSVIFRHFPMGDSTAQLQIDVNKLRTCPFDLLDLAAYNEDGACKIETNKSLPSIAANILPKGQREKYESLQNSLKNMFTAYATLQPLEKDLFGYFSFHFLSPDIIFEEDAGDFKIDTKLKRVARLKGNFNYFLNKARHDYIGRIDLNGIHFNSEHVTFTIKCKFYGEETSTINAWYDRTIKGWILDKKELRLKFPKIPHFNIDDDNFIVKESGGKDSKTNIMYCIDADTIFLDCPIEVTYTTKKDFLYNGKKRYKLSEIIKPFSEIKCIDNSICKDTTTLLNQAIKLDDMQDKIIEPFHIKLNFSVSDGILTIESL